MRWRVGIAVALGMITFAAFLPATGGAAGKRPKDGQIERVKHIVVMMQENRSYDHYFGQLHKQGQAASPREPKSGNPDPTNPSGPPIRPFHQTAYCEVEDVDHSWTGSHEQFNNGEMDGFTSSNAIPADPTGSRAMGFYDGQRSAGPPWCETNRHPPSGPARRRRDGSRRSHGPWLVHPLCNHAANLRCHA